MNNNNNNHNEDEPSVAEAGVNNDVGQVELSADGANGDVLNNNNNNNEDVPLVVAAGANDDVGQEERSADGANSDVHPADHGGDANSNSISSRFSQGCTLSSSDTAPDGSFRDHSKASNRSADSKRSDDGNDEDDELAPDDAPWSKAC